MNAQREFEGIPTIDPHTLVPIDSVSPGYQSYNIEMVEVTGGRFWKPYASTTRATDVESPTTAATPVGLDSNLFEYRPPIDLTNPRLRMLAAALSPAYVRVSGTWANTTYIPELGETVTEPPPGFASVLLHEQWHGVVDFARAVGAEIVTSMSIGPGTRDETGLWTPVQARRLLAATESAGGRIAAAEFMNEPNIAAMGGAPHGYDAAAYGRDHQVFRAFLSDATPDTIVLCPGSVGEGTAGPLLTYGVPGILATEDLLAECGTDADAFSFHHYGAASERGRSMGMPTIDAAEALSERWLSTPDDTLTFYGELRDRHMPNAPLWVTETGEAACGGDRWASTFLDTFRYLDQLGRLATGGVDVVMHNTLAASDYGLLDENTFDPRPNYWAALLWRKFMGTNVFDLATDAATPLHLYAHDLVGVPGGVALLVINTDRTETYALNILVSGQKYTLSSSKIDGPVVRLNQTELLLDGNNLPVLTGEPIAAGKVEFAPLTSTFVTLPLENNSTGV